MNELRIWVNLLQHNASLCVDFQRDPCQIKTIFEIFPNEEQLWWKWMLERSILIWCPYLGEMMGMLSEENKEYGMNYAPFLKYILPSLIHKCGMTCSCCQHDVSVDWFPLVEKLW